PGIAEPAWQVRGPPVVKRSRAAHRFIDRGLARSPTSRRTDTRSARLSGLRGPDLQVPRNPTHTVGDRFMATVWERAMARERGIIESLPPHARLDLVMKAAAWTREALPEEHKKLLRRRVGATLERAERF